MPCHRAWYALCLIHLAVAITSICVCISDVMLLLQLIDGDDAADEIKEALAAAAADEIKEAAGGRSIKKRTR